MQPMSPDEVAEGLAAVGRRFYARGWVSGTSGNFSAVVARAPLRLVITESAVHKGALVDEVLEVDEHCQVVGARAGKPSAETLLHVDLARRTGAGAVLHTHSVWGTVLSDRYSGAQGVPIEGYEMLKGLSGVTSHEHREWIPIVENSQDMTALTGRIRGALELHPEAHAVLIRRHGLYTWGRTLAEAERHIEILEFLLEAVGRTESGSWP